MKPTLILSLGCATAPPADRARTAAPAKTPKTLPENMLVPSRLDFHHSVAGLEASGKNSSAYTLVRLTSLCSSIGHERHPQGTGRPDGPAMAQGQEQKRDDRGQIRHRRQQL